MNATEKLIDRDLNELLGEETPPDLIARTLQRIRAGRSNEGPGAERQNESAPASGNRRSAPVFFRLATAACVALAVGLIAWVLWPRSLPETVTASAGASYLVRDDHIQLNQGWLLLTDGAPQVHTDHGRVSVAGRAVVGPAIPGDDALVALADQLGLSAEERAMLKMKERWLTAASLAMCLFTGQAVFNGEVVDAEDLPKPKVAEEKIEIPPSDDIEGVRKLLRRSIRVEVGVDGDYVVLEKEDAKRIATALTAEGFGVSKLAPGWIVFDAVTFVLPDHSKVETMGLSLEDDIFDMRFPGWSQYETYTVPAGAHDVLREYFEQAKAGALPDAQDVEKVREMLRSAESINVNRYGHKLKITDPARVTEITSAVASEDMKYSEKDLGEYDPWDWVWFNLPNGESARAIGLSQGSDMEKGYFVLYLPGSESGNAYTLPDAALPILKELFQETLKQPKSDETRIEREGEGEERAESFRVLRKFEGADSKIKKARVEVITDYASWKKMWEEHTGVENEVPDAYFDSEVAVAVFGGTSVNSRGYFVQDILKSGTGWVIRVDESSYQTVGGPRDVTPYGIWVVPNDGGSIIVEENVQGMKDEAPIWKSIGARLAVDDLRDDLREYRPSHTATHAGGPGVYDPEYRVVRSLNEWQAMIARVKDDSVEWPDPDFGDEIVVAVFGSAAGEDFNFKLDVWGKSAGVLYLRVATPLMINEPSKANLRNRPVFSVWVIKRPNLDVVIEGNAPSPENGWKQFVLASQKDEPFGVYDVISASSGGLEESSFGLANDRAELDALIAGMKSKPDWRADWIDWSRESVVVIFPGEMRVFDGISFTTDVVMESGSGDIRKRVDVLTYHMGAPSGGVDPGIKAQYAIVKVKKPTRTLVVKQSLAAGPGPAEVKEVARFEK